MTVTTESPPAATAPRPRGLDAPVTRLPSVGPRYGRLLDRLGIETVGQLLLHYPRRYVDYSKLLRVNELQPNETVTLSATVWQAKAIRTSGRLLRIEAVLADESGTVVARWYRARDFITTQIKDRQFYFSGRVGEFNGKLILDDPEYEPVEDTDTVSTGRLVPVYPATEGLNQKWLRRIVRRALDDYADRVPTLLPSSVARAEALPSIADAIREIHFPTDDAAMRRARHRIAFEELFLFHFALSTRRQAWQAAGDAPPVRRDPELEAAFVAALPFSLTGAQQRAADDLLADLSPGLNERVAPARRLIQGDVGSGKTVVAAQAALVTAAAGHQVAVMAPTEILAEQHFQTLVRLFESPAMRATFSRRRGREGPAIELLTGSLKRSARRLTTDRVALGGVDVIVGTHALIQSDVEFASLGLVIVDEQHRFGVNQRVALRTKGDRPHIVAMTATPIPRTLARTLFSDMDVSVIDELPPGRTPVRTKWIGANQREGAYEFVRKHLRAGRQAFVICPLVDDSDRLEVRSATAEFARLQTEVFPEFSVGLLHGRMKTAEKDAVMNAFRRGDLHVLVSTAVVEVGVDVPNATVMVIEAAERFGLAQLHQFRGRVGRGEHESFCLLISEAEGALAEARLRAVETTHNGFDLAQLDLELRGPGQFFGVRQSGLPELRLARLLDTALVDRTRQALDQFMTDQAGDDASLAPLRAHVAAIAEEETD